MGKLDPDMYQPVTAERALKNCCTNLLSHLGMVALYPERAAQISQVPAPSIVFVPHTPSPNLMNACRVGQRVLDCGTVKQAV
jgi:hypothetical protein